MKWWYHNTTHKQTLACVCCCCCCSRLTNQMVCRCLSLLRFANIERFATVRMKSYLYLCVGFSDMTKYTHKKREQNPPKVNFSSSIFTSTKLSNLFRLLIWRPSTLLATCCCCCCCCRRLSMWLSMVVWLPLPYIIESNAVYRSVNQNRFNSKLYVGALTINRIPTTAPPDYFWFRFRFVGFTFFSVLVFVFERFH